jgi:hypothetical protein
MGSSVLKVDCIPHQVTEDELKEAPYQASLRSTVAKRDSEKIFKLVQKERSKLEQKKDDGFKAMQSSEWSEKSEQDMLDALLLKLKNADEACHEA